MKALNSEKEREFEPYHKSPLVKTMTNNWHTRQKDNLVSTDISMNMTDIKSSKKDSLIETIDARNDVKILKTTLIDIKEDSHIVQKKLGMIEVEKERNPIEIMQEKDDIERQENNNKKDGIVMERTPRIESKEDDSMHKETDIVKRQTRCSKDEKDNKNHDLKELKRQLSRKRKTMVILK